MTREEIHTTLKNARNRKKTVNSTDILEISGEISEQTDHPYPYCAIPRHYFDRQLALNARSNRPELSVERW